MMLFGRLYVSYTYFQDIQLHKIKTSSLSLCVSEATVATEGPVVSGL